MLDTPVAWLVALGMLFVPPLLGYLAGALAARAGRLARGGLALLVVAAAALVPAFVATTYSLVNPFDMWVVGLGFALAFAVRAWPRARPLPRAAKWFTAGTILFLLVVVEIALRAGVVGEARTLRPPEQQVLTVDLQFSEYGCRAIFPDLSDERWFTKFGDRAAIPRRPGVRRVMHLGDSVLEANDDGMDPRAGYASILNTTSVGEEHLNLGIANTGTDVQLLLLRRWLPVLRPDAVVLHSYPGNDLGDIDRPFSCAGGLSLLEYPEGAPPRARFDKATWRLTLERSLELWPPPYALRVLGDASHASRHLVWRIAQWMESGPDLYAADEVHWLHYERIMAAFRDEVGRAGLPLRVVVLPDPEHAEDLAQSARGPNGTRMLRTLERLRIHAIDAAPALQAVARADKATPLMIPMTPHFNEAGHKVMAKWLRENLALWPASRR